MVANAGEIHPKEVNLEPTEEGYANILMFFCDQALNTSRERARKQSKMSVGQIIEISFYLGYKGRSDLKQQVLMRLEARR